MTKPKKIKKILRKNKKKTPKKWISPYKTTKKTPSSSRMPRKHLKKLKK